MLHFPARGPRSAGLLAPGRCELRKGGTGTDLFIGRHAFGILAAMKMDEIKVDYVVVDTLRVPRETFSSLSWKPGGTDTPIPLAS